MTFPARPPSAAAGILLSTTQTSSLALAIHAAALIGSLAAFSALLAQLFLPRASSYSLPGPLRRPMLMLSLAYSLDAIIKLGGPYAVRSVTLAVPPAPWLCLAQATALQWTALFSIITTMALSLGMLAAVERWARRRGVTVRREPRSPRPTRHRRTSGVLWWERWVRFDSEEDASTERSQPASRRSASLPQRQSSCRRQPSFLISFRQRLARMRIDWFSLGIFAFSGAIAIACLVGGLFGPAVSWCWIRHEFPGLQLLLFHVPILIAFVWHVTVFSRCILLVYQDNYWYLARSRRRRRKNMADIVLVAAVFLFTFLVPWAPTVTSRAMMMLFDSKNQLQPAPGVVYSSAIVQHIYVATLLRSTMCSLSGVFHLILYAYLSIMWSRRRQNMMRVKQERKEQEAEWVMISVGAGGDGAVSATPWASSQLGDDGGDHGLAHSPPQNAVVADAVIRSQRQRRTKRRKIIPHMQQLADIGEHGNLPTGGNNNGRNSLSKHRPFPARTYTNTTNHSRLRDLNGTWKANADFWVESHSDACVRRDSLPEGSHPSDDDLARSSPPRQERPFEWLRQASIASSIAAQEQAAHAAKVTAAKSVTRPALPALPMRATSEHHLTVAAALPMVSAATPMASAMQHRRAASLSSSGSSFMPPRINRFPSASSVRLKPVLERSPVMTAAASSGTGSIPRPSDAGQQQQGRQRGETHDEYVVW